jgi:hypothetical protein
MMTFALGLANVFVSKGSFKSSDKIKVDLPKVQSELPISVFPRFSEEIPYSKGSIYADYAN